MPTVQTNWEDDENNRRVELELSYQLNEGQVEIEAVTPLAVHFDNSNTNKPSRIGVWTETGRAMLVKQAISAGRIQQIREELHTGTISPARHVVAESTADSLQIGA